MFQINRFPRIEPKDAMNWSYNITDATMLRNIIGGSVGFGETLRRLAYRSNVQNRPFKVLEVTYGIPSIALELLNPISFRVNGDYFEYYTGSRNLDDITAASVGTGEIHTRFETPEVQITTVSQRDHLHDLLSGKESDFDGFSHVQQRISAIFYRKGQDYRDENKMRLIKKNYEEAQSQGHLFVHQGELVSQLKLIFNSGERYDLVIFNQLMYSDDRIRLLEASQSVISVGGLAYIPLTWWSPSFKGGTHEGTLLADVVNVEGRDLPLEEYLAQNYPNAFEVREFSNVKTLIVKGTSTPIKLPSMKAEIIEQHVSIYSKNHASYYPDMPVIRWTFG